MSLFSNFSSSSIRSLIEAEGKAADHVVEEKERVEKESIYLTDELDRLIQTEDLIERRHRNETLKQDREARKRYALLTFILTCTWCLFIFIVVLAAAEGYLIHNKFHLSDKILITLITSTTVNFFGFFILVMKYLFHTNSAPEKKSSKKKL
ncbi:MAG: hypothetical protein JWO09_3410 [Bacteroidetes bacterium]|nr:hypothetical protein [Bacteroidota bacterium]